MQQVGELAHKAWAGAPVEVCAQHAHPDGAVERGGGEQPQRVVDEPLLEPTVERRLARERWRGVDLEQPRLERLRGGGWGREW